MEFKDSQKEKVFQFQSHSCLLLENNQVFLRKVDIVMDSIYYTR